MHTPTKQPAHCIHSINPEDLRRGIRSTGNNVCCLCLGPEEQRTRLHANSTLQQSFRSILVHKHLTMGKKRKIDTVELELERSMYSSFVTAANAVSQLYTQGVQQQRRAGAAASKATLEKVVNFVLRHEEGSEHISKTALLQFLQHEYETVDSSDTSALQPQMQLMPFQTAPAASEETADTHPHLHKTHRQLSGNNMMTSPAGRGASAGRLMNFDEQHHMQQLQQQQQQQQQQAADALQMHSGVVHMATAAPFAGQAQHNMNTHVFMGSGESML